MTLETAIHGQWTEMIVNNVSSVFSEVNNLRRIGNVFLQEKNEFIETFEILKQPSLLCWLSEVNEIFCRIDVLCTINNMRKK